MPGPGTPPWVPVVPPSRAPGEEPGRVPARPVPQRVPVPVGAAASVAVQQAKARIPRVWRPSDEQVRALFPVDPRRAHAPRTLDVMRSSLAEVGASGGIRQSVLEAPARRSKGRLGVKVAAAATAVGAGMAAAGLYATRPRGGGGGGFHVNMAARMRALVAPVGVRKLKERPTRERKRALQRQQPRSTL